MSILHIARQQFERLNVPERCRSPYGPDSEVDWYADSDGKVFGVSFHVMEDNLWGYIVCVCECDESFREIGFGMDFKHFGRADDALVSAMQRHLARRATGGARDFSLRVTCHPLEDIR